jgi:pilus assembly protein Flp/PilA
MPKSKKEKEERKMFKRFLKAAKDEKGQALAEYGLILALIAVVCVAALILLGQNLDVTLRAIVAAL